MSRRNARRRYQTNYDRIAADHLAEYESTGRNPFMDESHWQMLEAESAALLRQYVQPGGTILDVGVGMGRILAGFPELDRYGIDIAQQYLPYAAQAGIQVIQGNADRLPYPDRFFDYLLCADVLEHVLDLNDCLFEISRVVKRGGLVFLRIPNEEDLTPYLDSPYAFVHLRSFREVELRLLLTRVFGMEIVQTWVGGELNVVARETGTRR